MPCLLIFVRFHDGRYHGRPEWPPSPARLFQGLIAGAAQGETLAVEDRRAFGWLESLQAPIIAAPQMRAGQGFTNFVPNNDLDAVGGDPRRIDKIRAPKLIRPILFEAETPLLYVWAFDDTPEAHANAQRICGIAECLYQLGRGVDMAWAWGEILPMVEAEVGLAKDGGAVHRPSHGGATTLAVPLKGSLESLLDCYKKMRVRFRTLYESRPTRKEPDRQVAAGQVFVQPPKPRFRQVAYDSPPVRLFFDLVGDMAAWRLDRIVELTERLRDETARSLKDKLPTKADKIHNTIIGRRDADEADKSARVRITPLPSIGHKHADHAIRRILVEIPPNCPLRVDDLEWGFSGLLLISDHGEILGELAVAADRGMLMHYGMEDAAPMRLWRTITPAALPHQAARRRIDPARRRAEAKSGAERAEEEGKAASAVLQALRHAGVPVRPLAVRVQREPFEAKGARAEAFAPGTRFAKERLWHAEITFSEPLSGPLVIGDGRYLGLGIMAPVRNAWRDAMIFSVKATTEIRTADRPVLVNAARRALMAVSRELTGQVSRLFSGHENDGSPAGSGQHEHVFLLADNADADGRLDRFVVAAPWMCDRSFQPDGRMRKTFDEVVSRLETVRAGRLGVIALGAPSPLTDGDPLIGPARVWESRTAYLATRHARRRQNPAAALVVDILADCARRALPRPEVEIFKFSAVPNGGGLTAHAILRFAVAVRGPVLLGRDSHKGGGVFITSANASAPR